LQLESNDSVSHDLNIRVVEGGIAESVSKSKGRLHLVLVVPSVAKVMSLSISDVPVIPDLVVFALWLSSVHVHLNAWELLFGHLLLILNVRHGKSQLS